MQSSEINVSGILKSGVALLVIAVVVHILMWGLFEVFNAREANQDRAPSQMFVKDQLPPEPILQKSPVLDLKKFNDSEADALNSYGWVDKEKGIVRIPIPEAMKLMLQREKAAMAAPPEEEQ